MFTAIENEESEGLLISAFYLGERVYGIPTTCVQEIVRFGGVTPVHQAPPFILGVMNLRGQIVTVFDLACRIGMPALAQSKDNRVIILDWSGEHVGLLVDEVFDVFPVEPEDIAPTPANMGEQQSQYVIGVLHHEGTIMPILEIDVVLADDDAPVDFGQGIQLQNRL